MVKHDSFSIFIDNTLLLTEMSKNGINSQGQMGDKRAAEIAKTVLYTMERK